MSVVYDYVGFFFLFSKRGSIVKTRLWDWGRSKQWVVPFHLHKHPPAVQAHPQPRLLPLYCATTPTSPNTEMCFFPLTLYPGCSCPNLPSKIIDKWLFNIYVNASMTGDSVLSKEGIHLLGIVTRCNTLFPAHSFAPEKCLKKARVPRSLLPCSWRDIPLFIKHKERMVQLTVHVAWTEPAQNLTKYSTLQHSREASGMVTTANVPTELTNPSQSNKNTPPSFSLHLPSLPFLLPFLIVPTWNLLPSTTLSFTLFS